MLKFYPNHRFFSLCNLEIWWMTSKIFRAHLLYYIKLCASFQIHWWIQTEVTVWKRSIRVKIGDFFVPCDLEIWWMTLENNRAPLPYYIKLCASFQSHGWIQTGVTVWKHSIWVKISNFLSRVTWLHIITRSDPGIDTTWYQSRVSKWHIPNDTLNRYMYLHPVFERKVTIFNKISPCLP